MTETPVLNFNASTSQSTPVGQKRKSSEDRQAMIKKAYDVINGASNDQWQTFGEFVASELRNLKNADVQSNLKRQIMYCILDAQSSDNQQNPTQVMSYRKLLND